MTRQLDSWRGDFGDAYTERNVVDPASRARAFSTMLEGLAPASLLEVGCNRGHNLEALRALLPHSRISGVEPNSKARALAGAEAGDIFGLPFAEASFDLVFTAGVLIHIALPDLPRALAEMHRVSRRWLLTIEYGAAAETPIPYRGRDDLLWKRDFLAHWRTHHPDLDLLRSGVWGPNDGFDHCAWWLLRKA